jgi:hypothetical protein
MARATSARRPVRGSGGATQLTGAAAGRVIGRYVIVPGLSAPAGQSNPQRLDHEQDKGEQQ